jgi:hypothetical protein
MQFLRTERTRRRGVGDQSLYLPEIFAVSFAVLLLEIAYTRIISFKLYYYFTYLVIGLSLLGLGAGGVFVAVSKRLREASTESLLSRCAALGALAVGVSYLVVAKLPTNAITVWDYNGKGLQNAFLLLVLCLALFGAFLPAGIILATLLGRRPSAIGRMYVADLLGAGLACIIVVPLISVQGAPAAVALAGLLFALASFRVALAGRSRVAPVAGLLAVGALCGLIAPSLIPDVRLDDGKNAGAVSSAPLVYSSWSPDFRVDVREGVNGRILFHDGLIGSGMLHWDGRQSSLKVFKFDQDIRAIPFAVAGSPPANQVIIGAAAGHEVVASLYFHASHIDAIELNPVTVDLVKNKMADYDGHLAQNPHVNYVTADGRSYLARSSKKYNLVWFPAPDSYSATNASTSSAFVLSESYLYTTGAVSDSLKHLAPGGIIATQFGEIDDSHPNRTIRYLATVRSALAKIGIQDAASHILVASSANQPFAETGTRLPGSSSTILVKKTPFTAAEISRFRTQVARISDSVVRYAPGQGKASDPIVWSVTASGSQLAALRSAYPYSVGAVTDDKPFFWHFTSFSSVLGNFTQPHNGLNLEIYIGERVLLVLLGFSILLAVVFLLLPFLSVRKTWRALPHKGKSAGFFASLGLGFILFEITLIQKLVLFLGYPTYSLTVSLSSLLIFVGVGAYFSGRWAQRPERLVAWLTGALTIITAYYLFGLQPTTDALQHWPLGARMAVAFVVIAPLGFCLGMFLPVGLSRVSRLSAHPREYVAWCWAINGFASVVGSVLATILAMTYGFRIVFVIAFALYLIALVALRALTRATPRPQDEGEPSQLLDRGPLAPSATSPSIP